MMGVWAVYEYRDGPYAISIHESAQAAEFEIAELGQGSYCFWPMGTDFCTAVIEWVYLDRSFEGPALNADWRESC